MMSGKTKWLLLILGLSVAVNLFAAGIFLGKEFRPERGGKGGPEEHVEFNLRRLAAYLPEDSQSELRAILREHRRSLRGHFRQMRQHEEKIKTLLLAETVDLAALEAALAAQEEGMNALKAPVRSIILDVVAKLDQETRQALAKDLFERRQRRGRGPEGRFRDGPPPHGRPPFGPDGPPPPPPEGEEGPGDDRPEPDGIR